MFNKFNLIIGGALVVILLGLGTFGGWHLRNYVHPDPIITTDTVKVTDPHWHHIADSLAGLPPKEVWKWLPRDTIKLPGDTIKLPVDSTVIKAMLKDYLATYEFAHEFDKNDTLNATVTVQVKKNHPIYYAIDYKFKIPFNTTINNVDNSTTYNSYLQAGINMPLQKEEFNKFKVEATMTFPKWYGGAGWEPLTNTWSARAGMTIFKIKNKK
jgi:hypothetical protein